MIDRPQTFIVRVRGSDGVVLENVGTRQSVVVDSMDGVAEQLERWLFIGSVMPDSRDDVQTDQPVGGQ